MVQTAKVFGYLITRCSEGQSWIVQEVSEENTIKTAVTVFAANFDSWSILRLRWLHDGLPTENLFGERCWMVMWKTRHVRPNGPFKDPDDERTLALRTSSNIASGSCPFDSNVNNRGVE